MSINVKLSEKTVEIAKKQAQIFNRTIGGQVDFWAKIGRLGELYPDLSFHYLMDLMHKNKLNEIDLVAGEEKKFNAVSLDTSQYKFDRDEANAR